MSDLMVVTPVYSEFKLTAIFLVQISTNYIAYLPLCKPS